jgi:tetratricopeptide (TPR) repeat protein
MRILLLLTMFVAGHSLFAQKQTPIDSLKASILTLQKENIDLKATFKQIEDKAKTDSVAQISGWFTAASYILSIFGIIFTALVGVLIFRGFNAEKKADKLEDDLRQREIEIQKSSVTITETISNITIKKNEFEDLFKTTQKSFELQLSELTSKKEKEITDWTNIQTTRFNEKIVDIGNETNMAIKHAIVESFEMIIKMLEKNYDENIDLIDEARNNFADTLKDLKDCDKAKIYLKGIKDFPNGTRVIKNEGHIWATYAEIYILLGEYANFMIYITKAIEKGYPKDKFIDQEKEAYIKAIKLPEFVKLLQDNGMNDIVEKLQDLAKKHS